MNQGGGQQRCAPVACASGGQGWATADQTAAAAIEWWKGKVQLPPAAAAQAPVPALGLLVQEYVQRTTQPHARGQMMLQQQWETATEMNTTVTWSAIGTANATAMVTATATAMVTATATETATETASTTATACTTPTERTSASASESVIEAVTATSATLMPAATPTPVCSALWTAVIATGTGTVSTTSCRSATPEMTPTTGTKATESEMPAEAPTSKTRTGMLP